MKISLAAAIICLALVAPGLGAPKKSKRGGRSTLPPTSKMIVLPAVPEVDAETGDHALIMTDIGGRDLRFFSDALECGLVQDFLAEQAKTRSEGDQLKMIAGALQTTQRQENKQIVRLAALKGVSLSSDPLAKQQAITKDLEGLSGEKFDQACAKKIIETNQQSVAAYESAAQSKDGDIKAFVEQMLPLAKEKLRLAGKLLDAGKPEKPFRTGGAPAKPSPAGPQSNR